MTDITAPNAGAYSIWGPAYAQYLAQQQGPILGPLAGLAMRSYMGNEQGAYDAALQRTQAAQTGIAEQEINAGITKEALGLIPAAMQYGGAQYIDPVLQGFGIVPNAEAGAARDMDVSQDLAAGAFKDRSTGVANMADAGFLPNLEQLAPFLFAPELVTETPALMPYMTPGAKADETTANARMKSAEADVISANRPRGGTGGGGGSTTYTVVPSIFGGPPQITVRTRDPGVVEEYTGQTRVPEPQTPRRQSRAANERIERWRRGD